MVKRHNLAVPLHNWLPFHQIYKHYSLQCHSLSYVGRDHSSGLHVTSKTGILTGDPQDKCFWLKTTLVVKSHMSCTALVARLFTV